MRRNPKSQNKLQFVYNSRATTITIDLEPSAAHNFTSKLLQLNLKPGRLEHRVATGQLTPPGRFAMSKTGTPRGNREHSEKTTSYGAFAPLQRGASDAGIGPHLQAGPALQLLRRCQFCCQPLLRVCSAGRRQLFV